MSLAKHPLFLFTVYRNHPGHPGKIAAMEWVVGDSPTPLATGRVIEGDTIEEVREQICTGNTCVHRCQNDHDTIIESWLPTPTSRDHYHGSEDIP